MAPLFLAMFSITSRGSSVASILYLFSKIVLSSLSVYFINSNANVSMSMISSLIAPVQARWICASLSSLCHNTPGVSNRCRSSFILIHWLVFVTPGRLPTLVALLLLTLFIKVLFPEFGIPTIIALRAPVEIPFSFCLSIKSFIKIFDSLTMTFGFPLFELYRIALSFVLSIASTQVLFSLGEAKSSLFRIMSLGFLIISLKRGFLLERGILASTTSMTKSTSFCLFSISSMVFFIWPGNQFIFILNPISLLFLLLHDCCCQTQ